MSSRHSSLLSEPSDASVAESSAGGLSPTWRSIVSLLLVLHLAAVFWGPFAFASNVGGGSSSPLADGVMGWLRPYVAMMNLDHGYFFFAPEPGPSHLVRYKIEFADGQPAIEKNFPSLKDQRPRLLYHRYFMVAEALNNSYAPPDPPPEPSPPPINIAGSSTDQREFNRVKQAYEEQLRYWRHRRRQYEALRGSIVAHLESEHPGGKATLTRVQHRPALPYEVQLDRKPLNSADTYRDLPERSGEQP